MISRRDLKSVYKERLEPELEGLEEQRKSIRNLDITSYLCGVLILVCYFTNPLYYFGIYRYDQIAESLPYIFSVLLIVLFFINRSQKKNYRSEYKTKVVRAVAKMIYDIWIYYPDEKVSEEQYKNSQLFPRHFDVYEGSDLIDGTNSYSYFQCSELHTKYKKESGSGNDKKTTWHTIFKGVFFSANFNKKFSGTTFIRTKNWSIDLASSYDTVEGNNPEFSKIFKVKTTNEDEARAILTPRVMEAFVDLYNFYRKPIDVSFLGTRLYSGISFNEELFKPHIYTSVYDLEAIEKLFELLIFNHIVYDELNQSLRVWAKALGY
ncbi:DUF3137 domain-containing protein [Flammeovirga aprica]|uniref:DUF3137 domain-containing protein n=1 Tax=Flammeovirga aprica JL-4 TaxID=694437 RepID=A0A7X9XD39_9BACT|nr:DUF3137 domain-containing protein [Flammeovirga aprica]NME72239.1 DUF3137 domain-containing protein [Flammeovirga aprica JL-4]